MSSLVKKKINLSGKKLGSLEIIQEFNAPYSGSNKNRKTLLKLKCKCECGQIFYPYKSNVITGKTTGCLNCSNSIKFIGKKIGSLLVINRDSDTESPRCYTCICDCGWTGNISSRYLRTGKNVRCIECRCPKKYTPISTLTREQAIAKTNYNKHLKAKEKWIGTKIGRLKIVSFSHWEMKGKRRKCFYNAKCKCGNIIIVRGDMRGRSCGCLKKDSALKGEDKNNSKLTNKQAEAIRELKKSKIGYTGRELSLIFGVSENSISKILTGKQYKENM